MARVNSHFLSFPLYIQEAVILSNYINNEYPMIGYTLDQDEMREFIKNTAKKIIINKINGKIEVYETRDSTNKFIKTLLLAAHNLKCEKELRKKYGWYSIYRQIGMKYKDFKKKKIKIIFIYQFQLSHKPFSPPHYPLLNFFYYFLILKSSIPV